MSTSTTEKEGTHKRHKRSAGRHLLLLMWKSLLLRRRHWLITLFEIILPTTLFSLILFLRLLPDSALLPVYHNETSIYPPMTEENLQEEVCIRYGRWYPVKKRCNMTGIPGADVRVFYGPPGNFTLAATEYVIDNLFMDHLVLKAVDSNAEIDDLVKQSYFAVNKSLDPYYISLFFNQDDVDSPPHHLDYDLGISGESWSTDSLFPFMQASGPGWGNESYIEQGFALIQSLVDRFYIASLTGNVTYMDNYAYEVQTYPYPPYYDDRGFSQLYGSFLPSYVVLSFLLLSPSLIKSVVHEKETGVRELVRLMGMNRWLMWGGWFLHGLMVVLVVVTIITIMITVGLPGKSGWIPPILNYSDPFYVWLMLALYGISSVAFCLTIATLFSRPTLATTVGILLWLTSYYLPNTFIYFRYDNEGLSVKLLACLLPNMAMTLGFRVLAMFEGRALGVQWNDLWSTGNPRDELTPALILIMLTVDILLYCLIIWYVDQVSPGTYGVAAPWYFPFQKSYWCPASSESLETEEIAVERRQYFEEEPEGLKPGIIIRNLRKEFKTLGGKTKVAVENVSMTCYEGQCTVLLGHNGAGKTTTMSVLTGVYGATSGVAEVGGWNIATHLKEARGELGLCPQHNMLFVDLTVLQHLLFFGRLKGMTTKEAKEEALEVLQRLELLDKKDMFGNQLSGGMKRKLCLAISLIGGSKVVILDEPSSGLDPESRRWVWQVVQGERGRRTFLVTTHHMEEADVLGDRVAIMAAGTVVCAGSTLFLKNKFGDGYTLEMIVKKDSNLDAITAEVKKHMSSASLHTQRGGEVSYKLPPTTNHFAPLLTSLTSHKEHFGISHVGLSLTTMEQVFLRVSEVMENEEKIPELHEKSGKDHLFHDSGSDDNVEIGPSKQQLYRSELDRLSGWKLLMQQLRAFFIKRAIYTKRKWALFITQGLLPVAISILCLLVDQAIDFLTSQDPPLTLTLDLFPSTESFVEASPENQALSLEYMSLFHDHHKVENVTNMMDSLLQAAKDDLSFYRESHITSASFLNSSVDSTLRVLVQTIPFHTTGIGTSLATNALLRYATGSHNYSITTTNRPMPPDTTWAFAAEFSTSSMVYANIMPLALAFLSASFLVFPLQERESNTKQVQLMTGAPVWGLWLTTFVWDMAAYLVTLILILILFLAFDPNGYFTLDEAPGALVVLLLLYGWGSIPMAYVFSFPFQTAASGFSILALVNIVAGQLLLAVVWVLKFVDEPGTLLASEIIHWIASLIPSYPAALGLGHLVETGVHNTRCDQFDENTTLSLCAYLVINARSSEFMQCCPPPLCELVGEKVCFERWSYYRMIDDGMGPDMLSLFVNGIIFFALIAFIEMGGGRILREMWYTVTCKLRRIKAMVYPGQVHVMEDDVAAETELVDSLMMGQGGALQDNTLLVHKLSKTYLGSFRPAVDNISFRVGRGECLGLLGVNGAGKTTTFKMLTGDEVPSAGDAMIDGLSLNRQRNKFFQNIGYCPQFDAFLGDLTGIEMLQLMGRLRGLREKQLQEMVSHLVKVVGMTECANRPSVTYSGGNRRKLSTAMSLIGEPPLVFLDEPTSGVDPASRRRVWAAVSRAVSSGQSVVLTSHSMEECEALCSRIIIMSRGTLRCVGTTAHLKAKYGQGYSLQVKLRTHGFSPDKAQDEQEYVRRVEELKAAIACHLPGAIITDQHRGMVAYRVSSSIGWGQLFTVMEALKNDRDPAVATTPTTTPSSPFTPSASSLPSTPSSSSPSIMEVYAASDTTLEQVFLSFAREVEEAQSSEPHLTPTHDSPSPWGNHKGDAAISNNQMVTEL